MTRAAVALALMALFAYGAISIAVAPLDKPRPQNTPAQRNVIVVGQWLMFIAVMFLWLTK
jgi:hypothetical protein